MHCERGNRPPRLPDLDPGVTLLDAEGGSESGPLYALVFDHLLTADRSGPAVWVDPGGTARAATLARLAPSPGLLDRIQVARGFTPHQHCALVASAVDRATRATPLVVVPGVDVRYRTDECPRGTAEAALSAVARRLDRIATREACPVLVTRRRDDDLTAPVEAVASDRIDVVDTRFGPRFRGEDFETTVYPVDGPGTGYQTTLAFWAEVLQHRVAGSAATGESDPVAGTTIPEVTASGPE